MRSSVLLLGFLLFATVLSHETFADEKPSQSFYSQAAAHAIARVLAQCTQPPTKTGPLCSQRDDISYLLLDTQSGAVLSSDWPNSDSPIPLGSLVKPFAALAYGEKHQFKYPLHVCHGTASGCWLPRGHGRLGLEGAIANSCNSYFRMLTRGMTAADVQLIATAFGLQPPEPRSSGAELAGVGGHWAVSPIAMAHAYVELSHRSDQPGVREILAGLAQSARNGTGKAVNSALRNTSALTKTGTAPCTHAHHAPGDGFAIVLLPADHPDILLMLRLHGAPGSQAAKLAGRLFQQVESSQ